MARGRGGASGGRLPTATLPLTRAPQNNKKMGLQIVWPRPRRCSGSPREIPQGHPWDFRGPSGPPGRPPGSNTSQCKKPRYRLWKRRRSKNGPRQDLSRCLLVPTALLDEPGPANGVLGHSLDSKASKHQPRSAGLTLGVLRLTIYISIFFRPVPKSQNTHERAL